MIGGFVANRGVWGGMRIGVLLVGLMLIPQIVFAILEGLKIGAILAPLLGEITGGATIVLYVVLIAHTVTLGLVGGCIGGVLAELQRK
jgi:hypothetical protein